jgi:hypothetical protein
MSDITLENIDSKTLEEVKTFFVETLFIQPRELEQKIDKILKDNMGNFSAPPMMRLKAKKWNYHNKEYIKERTKQRYQENRDKELEKSKQRYENQKLVECECGLFIKQKNLPLHRKSETHLYHLQDKDSKRCQCGKILKCKFESKMSRHIDTDYHKLVLEHLNKTL